MTNVETAKQGLGLSSWQQVLKVAVRRWKCFWKVQLAALLLTAAVVCALVLYNGYVNAIGAEMSGRAAKIDLLSDVAVDVPHGDTLAPDTPYSRLVASWKKGSVETAFGSRQIAAVYGVSSIRDATAHIPVPVDDALWVPEQLMSKWQLEVGSPFLLRFHINGIWHQVTTTVAGSYAATAFDQPLLVNEIWLLRQGVDLVSGHRGLYSVNTGFEHRFSDYVKHVRPEAVIITPDYVAGQAKQIVSDSFASSMPAISMLALLLVLGIGTINMLTFMDSKRELSVLKSLGMRPVEVGSLFLLEAAATTVLGTVAGLVAALVARAFVSTPLAISADGLRSVLTLVAVSYATAVLVPYRLACISTVNELMLDRPIPLLRQTHTSLTRRYPALEDKLGAGLKCLKLNAPDGEFAGIAFRKAGQHVKQGETVAWDSFAWGLGEKTYVAPCDGEVVECDLRQGLIAIRPQRDAANN